MEVSQGRAPARRARGLGLLPGRAIIWPTSGLDEARQRAGAAWFVREMEDSGRGYNQPQGAWLHTAPCPGDVKIEPPDGPYAKNRAAGFTRGRRKWTAQQPVPRHQRPMADEQEQHFLSLRDGLPVDVPGRPVNPFIYL